MQMVVAPALGQASRPCDLLTGALRAQEMVLDRDTAPLMLDVGLLGAVVQGRLAGKLREWLDPRLEERG